MDNEKGIKSMAEKGTHSMDDREQMRKLYRSQGNSEKVYIPARPKINLYDRNKPTTNR